MTKKKHNEIINILILYLALFFVFYFFNNFIGRLYSEGAIEALSFPNYFTNPKIYTDKTSFILSLGFTVLLFIMVIVKSNKPKKKEFVGVEHGSARWADMKELVPFSNEDYKKNILISQNIKINSDFLARKPKYGRNKNILVIGGSGTGKTRYFMKPNLMQMYGSYIVTDPKGSIISELGNMFDKNGYDIRVFNLKDLSQSMKYNPFYYINDENDILTLVNSIMNNSSSAESKGQDEFWQNAERMYFQALIAYMWETSFIEECNIKRLLELVNMGEIENGVNKEMDMLFKTLEKVNPDSFAVAQYNKFKQGAGDTLKSILISVSSRTAVFDITQVKNLLSKDELDLGSIAKKDTILFVILDDTNPSLYFLSSILYSQLINILVNQADKMPNSRFEKPVMLYLDEFANTGKIENFEKIISTIRSRNMGVAPVLQSKAQLEEMYEKKAETIIDNCDSFLFLGSSSDTTLKSIVEKLGKKTIEYEVKNVSYDKSNNKSISVNSSKTGRELMTSDEVSSMDNDYCIFQLRGARPARDKKFDLTSHENYKLTSDYDKANEFNIKQYINTYNANKKFKEDQRIVGITKEDILNTNVFVSIAG